MADSDRVGNETRTYNCHSYVFNGSNGWLDAGGNGKDNYMGTAAGCWAQDNNGTAKSNDTHSMLVANSQGKCGQLFLCKNNQNVYGGDTPTTVYKKL
jgi:hypothetical protein